MSRARFWSLWRYLHVTQGKYPAREGLLNKIKPVIDTLTHTFLQCYRPGQELSVDEAMVKYKGHMGGKSLHAEETCQAWLQDLVLFMFLLWVFVYISGVPWSLQGSGYWTEGSRKRFSKKSSWKSGSSLCVSQSCALL